MHTKLVIAAICSTVLILIGFYAPFTYYPAKLVLAGSGVAMLYLCMVLAVLAERGE